MTQTGFNASNERAVLLYWFSVTRSQLLLLLSGGFEVFRVKYDDKPPPLPRMTALCLGNRTRRPVFVRARVCGVFYSTAVTTGETRRTNKRVCEGSERKKEDDGEREKQRETDRDQMAAADSQKPKFVQFFIVALLRCTYYILYIMYCSIKMRSPA